MKRTTILSAGVPVLQATAVASLLAATVFASASQAFVADAAGARFLEGPARAVLTASELVEWENRLSAAEAETVLPDLLTLVADRLEVRYRIAIYNRYRADRLGYEQRMARYRTERRDYASDAAARIDWLAATAPPPLRSQLAGFTSRSAAPALSLDDEPPQPEQPADTHARPRRRAESSHEIVMEAPSPAESAAPRQPARPLAEDPAPTPEIVLRPASINRAELAAAVDGVNFAAGLLENAVEQERDNVAALAGMWADVSELIRRRRSLSLYLAIAPETAGGDPWGKLDAFLVRYADTVSALASESQEAADRLSHVQSELRRLSAAAERASGRR